MTPPATPDLGFPSFGGGPGGRLGRVGEGDIEGEEFWGGDCLAPKYEIIDTIDEVETGTKLYKCEILHLPRYGAKMKF